MKFEIKNLGPIKEAGIELGGLTVICGKNNTGKTYLTYSLYAFLATIRQNLLLSVSKRDFSVLLETGQAAINLEEYIENYVMAVEETVQNFGKKLPEFLAMSPERFKNTSFGLILDADEVKVSLLKKTNSSGSGAFLDSVQITETCKIHSRRKNGSLTAEIELLNEAAEMPERGVLDYALSALLARVFNPIPDNQDIENEIFPAIFPPVFIITCERTGAALFRTELVISQEVSLRSDDSLSERKKLNKQYDFRGYQMPVMRDLQFVIQLKNAESQQSFIAKCHPEIIRFFHIIAGGKYALKDNQVRFIPAGTNESLSLAESSSTVRSLMELNYYLKHKAKAGQTLMLDEPELNLHPENQRKLTRLLVRLVNAGVNVFINTHSDYIIKEFNTLLMLNWPDDKNMLAMRQKYGYAENELLSAQNVRVYCAENGNFVPVEVSQDVGIAISSFDENIRDMGIMQRDILSGGN